MANKKLDQKNKRILVSFILRAGLATVFLYAAISSFLEPNAWAGFIPMFLINIIPAKIFLVIYGVCQGVLALWLLSNKKTFYASIVSIILMLAIIVSNITALYIVFRDIPIMLSAIALAVLSYGEK